MVEVPSWIASGSLNEQSQSSISGGLRWTYLIAVQIIRIFSLPDLPEGDGPCDACGFAAASILFGWWRYSGDAQKLGQTSCAKRDRYENSSEII